MARPKLPGVTRHIFINPYVRVKTAKDGDGWSKSFDGDARIDKALAWLDSHPKGTVTEMCWQLIVAAVNGELGVAVTTTLANEDDERAQKALDELLANMVLDDE
jgi:hypothetical protein